MYISGHQDIIDAAINTPSQPLKFSKNILEELKQGTIFPDVGCKKLAYKPQTSPTNSLQNHDLFFRDTSSCSIFKLFKTLHGRDFGFTSIYQFHRGLLAHLHSMATDPTLTLLQQRKQILDIILALLATVAYGDYGFKPKSAYVFGIILHTITDSYPKGHTVRQNFHDTPLVIGKHLPIPKQGLTKRARYIITDHIKLLAKSSSTIESPSKLIDILTHKLITPTSLLRSITSPIKTYLSTQPDRIYHTYLIAKFIEYTKQTASISKRMLNLPQKLGISNGPVKDYDIIHFQLYDIQDSMYHKQHDLLSSLSEHISNKMVGEVRELLEIFYKFYKNKLTPEEFIKASYTFIATNTYHISKLSKDNMCAMPKKAISR